MNTQHELEKLARSAERTKFREEALIKSVCAELKMTRTQLTEHVKQRGCAGLPNMTLSNVRKILNVNLKMIKYEESQEFMKSLCRTLKISENQLKQRVENFSPTISLEDHQRLRAIFGTEANNSLIRLQLRTPEQKQRETIIVRLWKAKKTYKQIAVAMGISLGSAIRRIHILRCRGVDLEQRNPFGVVNPPGYNPTDLGKRLRNGESPRSIAESFNKSYKAVLSTISVWRYKYPEAKIPFLSPGRRKNG